MIGGGLSLDRATALVASKPIGHFFNFQAHSPGRGVGRPFQLAIPAPPGGIFQRKDECDGRT